MFWNDPILYGASFPYRDIPTPVQTPFAGPVFTPWQNVPRFVPPIYGFQNPFMNPYMQHQAINPFVHALNYPMPQINVPPQFNVLPQFNMPPQLNVPQLGLPQLTWNRPFACC